MGSQRNKAQAHTLVHPHWVWKGPVVDGVTQSILKEFLICRERCRLKLKEGLKSCEDFSVKLCYGTLFHSILEGQEPFEMTFNQLAKKHPEHIESLMFWRKLVVEQSKAYQNYWSCNLHILEKELVFDVMFKGYRLRGKIDAIILQDGEVWLLERKSTSQVDDSELISRVGYDLQTGFYLSALVLSKVYPKIAGVYYDVIRRPLSGGRYGYRQKQGENSEEYVSRVCETFRSDPTFYFNRFAKVITRDEIKFFFDNSLKPILDEMREWYESDCKKHHWIMPFGVVKRYRDSLDDYIHSGGSIRIALDKYEPFSELMEPNDDSEQVD